MRGPGGDGAPVAVGLVGGFVQVEGEADDPVGERQDPQVLGEQLDFGQGLACGRAGFGRGLLRARLLDGRTGLL